MYLDMNGIIHNCTHSDVPEAGSGGRPPSDEQMYTVRAQAAAGLAQRRLIGSRPHLTLTAAHTVPTVFS
jgi:hypothetical protein